LPEKQSGKFFGQGLDAPNHLDDVGVLAVSPRREL
jgi:hypothetical protein